ncbi:MAG: Calx-beta domain-containing protein, partial [Acidimicrobiales bacterium]
APLTGTPITLTGSDPNGDDITFATTTSPTKGIVTCTGADGSSCTYTAAAGKTGTDSFKFTATDPDGASKQATISINLDANTPGVYVGQVDFVEPETGNGTFRSPFIPVMLTTPAPAPVTVWYHTVDGTAVTTGLGGDYREWGTPSSPRSLTIPAGQTTGYIQPPVFDDDEVEPTEHFDVVVTSLTGGASYLGGTGRTRVNIIDADTISTGTPILSVLDATQYEGNAGTRTFGFRVVLSKPATAPVKVTCTPVSGTAIAGVDFKAGAKTVTIGTGGLSAAVDILGYANANQQGIRTFTLSCAIVGTADVNVYRSEATATTAIATILDED